MMNIKTVAENLRDTIAGEEKYLSEWNNANLTETSDRIHRATVVGMLKVHIDELKHILQDVEQCEFDYEELKADLTEANSRVRQLKQQASDDSWDTNPDRMGGGGWSAEELDPNRGWK
jgi:hypothetical protein